MTENDLYELVADCGYVYGPALPRDIYLANGVDWPRNWLEVADEIGDARAEALSDGLSTATSTELHHLIRWQVDHALDAEDPALVATIWLCQKTPDDDVFAVESWGTSLNTELRFNLIGRYPDRTLAIKGLRSLYIFDSSDL